MKKILIVTIVLNLLMSVGVKAQKKYDDIYMGMPNMSLGQQYSELMEYQRTTPYFANTYVQLGVISKNMMILTDPLRDIESAQFWAGNAALFFGNFKVFYEKGDVRSNSEYYENLNIPHADKKITDEELFDFIDKNATLCKNFKDSTLLAYQAIEKSKGYYNKCITTFKDICYKYDNLNEALLQYDEQLRVTLEGLGNDIDSCVAAFKEYKAILKAYPIMNYRQLYDFKEIVTFRLDGITNSNFYDNRFTMWDYQKWIAEFEKILKEDIMPLRAMVADIDERFQKGKQEYESQMPLVNGAQPVYDELFVFRLGRYDNNSLVRELFAYYESRRQLMQMACDSIILPIDTAEVLINRKMRHLYRMSQMELEARRKLSVVESVITPERVVRFKEFFESKYGGLDGMKALMNGESAFLSSVMSKTLGNYDAYHKAVEMSRDTVAIMKSNSYVPSLYVRNAEGRVIYVAGVKKGVTSTCFVAKLSAEGKAEWTTDIRKTQEVTSLSAVSEGVIVTVKQNEMPNALVFGLDGKQKMLYGISEGRPTSVTYNDIAKVTYISHDISDSQSSVAKLDSIGGKIWDVTLDNVTSVESVIETEGSNLIVVAKKDGASHIVGISADGKVGSASAYFEQHKLDIVTIYRASAQEICLACRGAGGEMSYVIIDNKMNVVYTSK